MLGIILGVLGIAITFAFGIYSIRTYKKTKRVVSLEFKNRECYSLFRDDVKRLNIELSYNKKPLSSALILLKAKVFNNGQVDIDKSRIYKPLKIISTKEFKWLESRITCQPIGATTNVTIITQNEIQIDWDLLKTKEFIEIEALIEIDNYDKLEGNKAIKFFNELTFDYRITDLNSIQKENVVSIYKKGFYNQYSRTLAISFMFGGLLLFISGYYPPLSFLSPQQIQFRIESDSNKFTGYLVTKNSDLVEIRIPESRKKIKIPIKEFNEKYKIVQIDKYIIETRYARLITILSIIYFLMGVLLLLLKSRNIRRLLHITDKNRNK
jgi:hypothetical protein